MNTTLDDKRLEIELDAPEKPKRKSRKKAGPAADAAQAFESNPELLPVQWTETGTEPAELGLADTALAAGLQGVVDWIDAVNPVTGEITRQPVLKGSPPAQPEPAEAQNVEPDATQEPDTVPVALEAELPAGEPAEPEVQAGLTEQAGPEEQAEREEHAGPKEQAERKNHALAEIVDFLLSPEGAELRRTTREAAYQARKAAYQSAQAELEQAVAQAHSRLEEIQTRAADENAQARQERAQAEQALAAARRICQGAQRQAAAAEQAFANVQARYTQAAGLADKARTLADLGQAPAVLVERLEAECLAAAAELLTTAARHEQAQIEQDRETAALARLERSLQSTTQALTSAEAAARAEIQAEIERLQAGLKDRQAELAAGYPEVRLWQALQAERLRREDELAGKLIARLPSQGIRKVLGEAAQLGIAHNPGLQAAVAERQLRVEKLIEFCRAKAETLSAFPEALPDGTYALLVRGDTIRAVDAAGRELAVLYANADGTELQTVPSKNGRRWKLDGGQDLYQVKK